MGPWWDDDDPPREDKDEFDRQADDAAFEQLVDDINSED
jgi:hypothetical protein